MIAHDLPKRIRLAPASAIFSATFNLPTLGKYDFNGQRQIFIKELVPNSVYLIDAMTVGGNVAGEDYLSAIETVPIFSLQKTNDNENIFDMPFPIQGFWTDRQISRYFKTGLNKCGLSATLTGLFYQVPAFVGLATLELSINLTIYGIDESTYEKAFSRKA